MLDGSAQVGLIGAEASQPRTLLGAGEVRLGVLREG